MQVTIHSIDHTNIVDFPDHKPPFVAIKLYDGQGAEINLLLTNRDDVVRLAETAKDALGILSVLTS